MLPLLVSALGAQTPRRSVSPETESPILVASSIADPRGAALESHATASSLTKEEIPDAPEEESIFDPLRNRGRIPRDPNYGHIGLAFSIGVNGVAADLGVPINRFLDLRVGADGFYYAGSFREDTDVYNASLRFAYGKAHLDYYPFAGHFRVSPMLVFANYTHPQVTYMPPAATTFDLSDSTYVSSPTDPLRATGSIDIRHTSPGLTIGFNRLTRGYGAFSFPMEAGAYYIGAPTLNIALSGSVCTPNPPISCQSANSQPDFQTGIATYKTHIDQQLSKWGRFIPVLNFGIGYRFGKVL